MNRVEAKANVDEFVSALDRLKSLSSDRKGVIKVSLKTWNNEILNK